jgi:hypothetical protein
MKNSHHINISTTYLQVNLFGCKFFPRLQRLSIVYLNTRVISLWLFVRVIQTPVTNENLSECGLTIRDFLLFWPSNTNKIPAVVLNYDHPCPSDVNENRLNVNESDLFKWVLIAWSWCSSFLGKLDHRFDVANNKNRSKPMGSIASPKCLQGETIQFLHVFIYLFNTIYLKDLFSL